MVRQMDAHHTRIGDPRCVWMKAGLLAYRLCDREFDCEHCPLDAALRGEPLIPGGAYQALCTPAAREITFPDDRFYTRTHTWIRPFDSDGSRMRFGLDTFAASLLHAVLYLQRIPHLTYIRSGQVLCVLELEEGVVPLGAPLAAKLEAWNSAIDEDLSLLIRDPYGSGWIAELATGGHSASEGLLDSEEAHHQAHYDMRRFRRRIALQLLADVAGTSDVPSTQIGPDLRQVVGTTRYLTLIQEFIR